MEYAIIALSALCAALSVALLVMLLRYRQAARIAERLPRFFQTLNRATDEQTDDIIAGKQDAYELFSRNDQQKIEGDGLVYRLSSDEWVNVGELALKSDLPTTSDFATKAYVDETVGQEASTRQAADQELRASLGEKADISQVPTKTSQLTNDSGFIGTEQLSDYYTKE